MPSTAIFSVNHIGQARKLPNMSSDFNPKHIIAVSLLTGGSDKPYVFGLATSLMSRGLVLDLIGSDDIDCPEFHNQPHVNFLKLRAGQSPDVSFKTKILRTAAYYTRLIGYAAKA